MELIKSGPILQAWHGLLAPFIFPQVQNSMYVKAINVKASKGLLCMKDEKEGEGVARDWIIPCIFKVNGHFRVD